MKKKLFKSFLISILPISTCAIVVSCKDNENQKPDVKPEVMTDSDFESLVNTSASFDVLLNLNFSGSLAQKGKNQILPTEIQEKKDELIVKLNQEYEGKIEAQIVSVILETPQGGVEPSNISGQLTLSVLFKNKATNKNIIKAYKVDGFAKNNGQRHDGKIPTTPTSGLEVNIKEYLLADQAKRFELDNKKYMEILKKQFAGETSLSKIRPDLKATESEQNMFNNVAKAVGFDNYYEAALKGFTLPVYENGKVQGLRLQDAPEIGKGPSWIDSYKRDPYKTNGLARTLPNEKYRDLAEQTFQIRITNKNDFKKEIGIANENIAIITSWNEAQLQEYKESLVKDLTTQHNFKIEDLNLAIEQANSQVKDALIKQKTDEEKVFEAKKASILKMTKDDFIQIENDNIKHYQEKIKENNNFLSTSGTMWIMDYQIDSNGAVKWYFGTNAHVAKFLTDQTTSFSLLRINENVGIGTTLKLSELDENFTRFTFNNNKGLITKVFDGTDFMNTTPSQYLAGDQKTKFKDVEEFVDFAVIEIDFSKTTTSQVDIHSAGKSLKSQYQASSMVDLVKFITNNYETKTDKHIKFKKESYLKNYDQIDRPLAIATDADKQKIQQVDNLFILGYPSSEGDYFLEKYIDDDQIKAAKQNFSLWINSDYRYYKKLTTQEGAPASFSKEELARGNFLSYEIGYRSFINKPGVTDGFLAAHRFGNDLYEQDGKFYLNFALEYLPRFYAPYGGASGSSVRTQNNEVVGVVHVSNNSAKTGLVAALRSEGYDYNGLFGDYNLPQYDLIYGGGKEQKNSYRQEMKKRYGGIKTALFPNGFDEIPEGFEF
ncbi:Membrane-associated lipoprotein precursor [Mycoplasmopsis californica]|uniref:DUF31 family protein n=1 Tax=Mycoplasmopsis equigenitalium TaxID=114883 RepID=A0ABY5J4Y8_9BACT|nr:DUF31 family protein [Mycoplasmopsis equigenitalium]UUD37030.1 DUF31 family protein [Mycoplasmopsis equigenitalium]VEU69670.1 Membrane-associated lipoprotein precursor [Mycoplasmopsis californica]